MEFPDLASFILLMVSASHAQYQSDGELLVRRPRKCDEDAVLQNINYTTIKDGTMDFFASSIFTQTLDHESTTFIMLGFPQLKRLVFETKKSALAYTVNRQGRAVAIDAH